MRRRRRGASLEARRGATLEIARASVVRHIDADRVRAPGSYRGAIDFT